MLSHSHHLNTTPVGRNVRCLANHQNDQMSAHSGNSLLPPAKGRVSVPSGQTDSSQGESSLTSTIQSQNSTPSSSVNNSRVANITQDVTSTPSATQQRWINTPTAKPGTSSRSSPAPRGASMYCIVFIPSSGIAITPTPFSGLENLPTSIPNPWACAIIANPLRMRATEKNQRQRLWQLQPPAVSTARWTVSGSCGIRWLGHSVKTGLVFATGRLLELYMWNRQPFMSPWDLGTVSYATRRVSKVIVEAPHWQILLTYWNTAMQQNDIWSIPFEARTKEILKEVCWSNGPEWMLHAQASTRFEHKSIRLNPISFNQQGTTY